MGETDGRGRLNVRREITKYQNLNTSSQMSQKFNNENKQTGFSYMGHKVNLGGHSIIILGPSYYSVILSLHQSICMLIIEETNIFERGGGGGFEPFITQDRSILLPSYHPTYINLHIKYGSNPMRIYYLSRER